MCQVSSQSLQQKQTKIQKYPRPCKPVHSHTFYPVAGARGRAMPDFRLWIHTVPRMCKGRATRHWHPLLDPCTSTTCTSLQPKCATQGPSSQQPRLHLHAHLDQSSLWMPRSGCCRKCLGSSTCRNPASLVLGYHLPNMCVHSHRSCLVGSKMDLARLAFLLQRNSLQLWNRSSCYHTSTTCIGPLKQAPNCFEAPTCLFRLNTPRSSVEKNACLVQKEHMSLTPKPCHWWKGEFR